MTTSLIWAGWSSKIFAKKPASNLKMPHPNSINIDSRTLKDGDWFCPIIGENFDGHRFIGAAQKITKTGFFYQSDKKNLVPKDCLPFGIEVLDTLITLQEIAKNWRLQQENLTVFAITGSVGKTTTRIMLSKILSAIDKTHVTKGNYNNEIGVPLSLLKLKPEDRYCVLEFGARHLGDISFLSKIACPNIVSLLNVGTAHLGEFGSLENLYQTKLEIFQDSPLDSALIAFSDDPIISSGAKKAAKLGNRNLFSFGLSDSSDLKIQAQKWRDSGELEIDFSYRSKMFSIELGVSHISYPINVAAAFCMAISSGIEIESLKDSLMDFSGISGRYKLSKFAEFSFIDDCYNANPESMNAGLSSLEKSFANKKKLLVLGDMLELGENSKKQHFELGARASRIEKISKIVTVGDLAVDINKGAIEAGYPKDRLFHFKDVDQIIGEMPEIFSDIEIIYLKASNGINLSKLVNKLNEIDT